MARDDRAPGSTIPTRARTNRRLRQACAQRRTQPAPAASRVAFVTARTSIRASTSIVTREAEIFGDPVAVAALVDRLIHHAEVIVLEGESYGLRGKREEC